jgi:hypothetical protein
MRRLVVHSLVDIATAQDRMCLGFRNHLVVRLVLLREKSVISGQLQIRLDRGARSKRDGRPSRHDVANHLRAAAAYASR